MNEEVPEDEYRFGFTPAQIVAEVMTHRGVVRDGCYVPTRTEVATWPADRLWATLLGWWWESPTSLTPNDAQITECVAVLHARPDAQTPSIQAIIAQAPSEANGNSEDTAR